MSHMMMGALGSYSMAREASGTSWQPDSSAHGGVQGMVGDWMLMGHALLNGVYDWQQGPRGDTDVFISGMLMGMADRHFDSGDTLQFRAMLSPEPLMGKSGYPLLLATGETADGIDASWSTGNIRMTCSWNCRAPTRTPWARWTASFSMPACPESRRLARRHSCIGNPFSTVLRRPSAITGWTPCTSPTES